MSCPTATISVLHTVGASPGFRDSAALLFADIDDAVCEVVLDFTEVTFISRGFADELHQVRQLFQAERGLTVTVEHANEEIMAMLGAVSRTQHGRSASHAPTPLIHISGAQGLEDLLLGL